MELYYVKAIFALLLVLGLIGISAIVARKISNSTLARGNRVMRIKEVLVIDQKRKVVIVEKQNKSYTLLLGQNDLLIDREE